MEKILMKRLENNNMTLNNHKRYRYGAEFYIIYFIQKCRFILFWLSVSMSLHKISFSIMTPFVHIV